MKDLEQILDDCIEQILSGTSTVEDCLEQYPGEAGTLEPMLRIGEELQCGRWLHVPASFKIRTRVGLQIHMQSNPRRATGSGMENPPGAES